MNCDATLLSVTISAVDESREYISAVLHRYLRIFTLRESCIIFRMGITSVLTKAVVFCMVMMMTYVVDAVNNTVNVTVIVPPTGGGGLSADGVAALWAGFMAGMIAIFGFGMLFYDYTVRKYVDWYPGANNS